MITRFLIIQAQPQENTLCSALSATLSGRGVRDQVCISTIKLLAETDLIQDSSTFGSTLQALTTTTLEVGK